MKIQSRPMICTRCKKYAPVLTIIPNDDFNRCKGSKDELCYDCNKEYEEENPPHPPLF